MAYVAGDRSAVQRKANAKRPAPFIGIQIFIQDPDLLIEIGSILQHEKLLTYRQH
jgi:hypothetical protein